MGEKSENTNRSSENYGMTCNLRPRKRTEKITRQSYMQRDNSREFFKSEGRHQPIDSRISGPQTKIVRQRKNITPMHIIAKLLKSIIERKPNLERKL